MLGKIYTWDEVARSVDWGRVGLWGLGLLIAALGIVLLIFAVLRGNSGDRKS
jgi:hypothetical protein